ncbi:hypothetical protein BES34_000600 [Leptospira inadai serovar Lyme]|uniref:Uncharacterized protein n=1 Tax=Leptospira inadai serovar Lyme TaxID=293084 RepID=A0ABX4YNI7_9LEPT|nr:hypothetical protein BES34_000600 [Leptospira inadai serovar Lyme]
MQVGWNDCVRAIPVAGILCPYHSIEKCKIHSSKLKIAAIGQDILIGAGSNTILYSWTEKKNGIRSNR